MSRILLCIVGSAILLAGSTATADPLVLCGWDEVFILDSSDAEQGQLKKLWSWRAADRMELPEALRGRFGTTDDCKPVDGGAKLLISSSGGGCALVELPAGRVLWYANVPNAHSLELLPRDRLVVASSVHPAGNRLIVYDLTRSDQPVWETPLISAHGVVWDDRRQVLWALGLNDLRGYELRDWTGDKPSLALTASHVLPDPDGHDLQAVPPSDDLVVTTGRHVYLFDRQQRQFRLHPELADKPRVKSVSVHPTSRRTVVVQASGKEWWTDTLDLLAPPAQIRLPGERLYKARWMPRWPIGQADELNPNP